MKTKKNTTVIALMAAALLLFSPLAAGAEMTSVTGTLTGFTCFMNGYTCPIDRADPLLGLEKDFVLVVDKEHYYLLPNVSFGIKARHALETVTVKGTVNEKYRAIAVDELWLKGKLVWSQAIQDELRKAIEEAQSKP